MTPATQIEPTSQSAREPSLLSLFFKLAEVWSLTTEQQITLLGGPARSTFFKWKNEGGKLSTDTEDRISHLTAAYKTLQILFPNPVDADQWIKKSNRLFDGKSALDVMLQGRLSDIILVRNYLDAQRGG